MIKTCTSFLVNRTSFVTTCTIFFVTNANLQKTCTSFLGNRTSFATKRTIFFVTNANLQKTCTSFETTYTIFFSNCTEFKKISLAFLNQRTINDKNKQQKTPPAETGGVL